MVVLVNFIVAFFVFYTVVDIAIHNCLRVMKINKILHVLRRLVVYINSLRCQHFPYKLLCFLRRFEESLSLGMCQAFFMRNYLMISVILVSISIYCVLTYIKPIPIVNIIS